jgi:predicted Zn-dependent peptidase
MLGLEYKTTPYHWPVIGSMEHLDAATVTDFKEFFAKYYVPNNACLILTGNVNVQDAKQYIDAYFQRIPRGNDVIQPKLTDKPSGNDEIVEKTIKGLKEPHMMISYVTVPQNQRDAKILEFLLAYLQQSDSPLLALENDKKNGISRIRASAELYELAGSVWFRTSYNDSVDYREVLNKIDREFIKLSKGLSQKEFIRLKAAYESGYSDLFFDTKFLSESLGLYHFFWGDAQKLNGVIDEYLSITNDEIIAVVNTYFVHGNRKIIVYHPETEKK